MEAASPAVASAGEALTRFSPQLNAASRFALRLFCLNFGQGGRLFLTGTFAEVILLTPANIRAAPHIRTM